MVTPRSEPDVEGTDWKPTTDLCSRCVAVRVQLTPAHWEAMKGMEAARKMRLPAQTAESPPSDAAAQSLSEQLAHLQDSLGAAGPEDDGSAARIAASIAARAEELERAASN